MNGYSNSFVYYYHYYYHFLNPLLNDKVSDWSKLKEIAVEFLSKS